MNWAEAISGLTRSSSVSPSPARTAAPAASTSARLFEVVGDHFDGAGDHEGAADQVDGQILGAPGQSLDVGGDFLQAGSEHVEVGAALLPLEPLRFLDPDAQRPGQDEIEVVAAAGQ